MASLKGTYPQKFKKEERLSGKKSIDLLFNSGRSINVFPLKVLFLQQSGSAQKMNQVLFTVPKKNFNRATDRNILKRRMRESFRKNKYRLVNASVQNLLIAYIYIDTGISDYQKIEKSVIDSILQLIKIKGEK